jgi:hypothetical protein
MSSDRPYKHLSGRIAPCFLVCALLVVAHTAFGGPSPYPAKSTVAGQSLKRIGSGLREFLFFDIYTMGAYSTSGSCDPGAIVYKDEVKYLRLDMIREISKERMRSTLRDTLLDNLPKNNTEQMKKKIEVFLSYLKKDLQKGAVMEILYVPGKGTLLKQDGRDLGPYTTGKQFAETLWRSYFGGNTCCKSLKSDIIEQCKAGK